jgi:HipA-like C-terminal domain
MANPLHPMLEIEGPLSAPEAARRLGVEPLTVARHARAAGGSIVILGRGKSTRYALPETAITGASQLPLYWISEDGAVTEFATVSFVKPQALHVYGSGINAEARKAFPWFLAPLALRGYIGRASRSRLGAVANHWDTQPERWTLAQQIFSAQSAAIDHAGAILLGDEAVIAWQKSLLYAPQNDSPETLESVYDTLADEAVEGRIAGSSADGEQPKFSTRVVNDNGETREVLVKFSPPRGTPFGERWNDLLHAEGIAATVLHDHGFAVPYTRIIKSTKRTYLESARIDRIGASGRRHLLPLHAIHAAFLPGTQQHWANTVARLAAQKRIAQEAVTTTQTLYAFGQLIGNTDMHFGNLGVIAASPEAIAKGRFTLAPCYDMLPMRFAPGAHSDLEYTAFATELNAALPEAVSKMARELAHEFWRRIAGSFAVSDAWRAYAAQLA